MKTISYVCDGCLGDDPDCYCRQPPKPTDCDHKGGFKYWCGYCPPPPLIDE